MSDHQMMMIISNFLPSTLVLPLYKESVKGLELLRNRIKQQKSLESNSLRNSFSATPDSLRDEGLCSAKLIYLSGKIELNFN